MKAPEEIADNVLVLMADIFPTGYFAAHNAFKDLTKEQVAQSTVVVIGCGPVGLCAVINAEDYKPKNLLAVDSVQSRLDLAKSLGAEPWNFQTDREGLDKRVKELTEGRGADVVIEVVGLSPALKMGFELLRPWGVISSVGVHNGEIPWNGNQAYGKNLRIQMGRCPVRSIFPQALEKLKEKQDLLGFMSDKIMPLSEAVEGYDLFDKMKVQKGEFVPKDGGDYILTLFSRFRSTEIARRREDSENDGGLYTTACVWRCHLAHAVHSFHSGSVSKNTGMRTKVQMWLEGLIIVTLYTCWIRSTQRGNHAGITWNVKAQECSLSKWERRWGGRMIESTMLATEPRVTMYLCGDLVGVQGRSPASSR